ncbi:flagellar biosynthesis protein FlhF [Amphritea japonica]|uniref:Flagellar biosynthesis protein FlhF n=1 Tax=Amphritea japonica ATCC BAA-1530 TaxID=1278309 RepID=A0A7R6SRW0_9GAMM|nr:flagellar biosynthesis protein FlhF [Amphritea japonica]BBB25185.1 flagellar biosynthesis protein FlhF [Amphritea japonica ATCC BAA-1530]
MKVKRFFAPDMRQAMQRVRDEIGPDAVIVSNHRVAGGVEVVAAHEHEYEAAQQEFKRKRAAESSKKQQGKLKSNLAEELRKAQARIATAQDGGAEPRQKNRQMDGDDEELNEILDTLKKRQRGRAYQAPRVEEKPAKVMRPQLDPSRQERQMASPVEPVHQGVDDEREVIQSLKLEIDSLKNILSQPQASPQRVVESHAAPASERSRPTASPIAPKKPKPRHELADSSVVKVERRLERIGLGPQISRQLSATVGDDDVLDDAWRSALTRFSDNIPVMGEDFVERGGMIAFVGPTGVGKTTTIGKLAARYVLKHGSSSVALVTTDSFRIAAHEQLLTFGRILDVPVRVVDENNPLEEVLTSLRGKRLVLIDTAGMSAHEPHTQAQLSMLDEVTVRMKKLLVLSCSSQRHVIESAYETYAPLGLHGCVLSKLDESGNLGEALDLVMENGLSVSYVTDGQRVPDDIDVAHKKDLVSRAVVTAQKASRSHRVFSEHQQERLARDEQWEN